MGHHRSSNGLNAHQLFNRLRLRRYGPSQDRFRRAHEIPRCQELNTAYRAYHAMPYGAFSRNILDVRVLGYNNRDGRPLVFVSGAFKGFEPRCSTVNKEVLAVEWACSRG